MEILTAYSPIECGTCYSMIEPGEKYERQFGHRGHEFITCLQCVENAQVEADIEDLILGKVYP